MHKDLTAEPVQSQSIIETASAEDEVECGTVCYHPECACRERTIAGCSLPIATTVQIERTPKRAREE